MYLRLHCILLDLGKGGLVVHIRTVVRVRVSNFVHTVVEVAASVSALALESRTGHLELVARKIGNTQGATTDEG
jgi:hypothetical protein